MEIIVGIVLAVFGLSVAFVLGMFVGHDRKQKAQGTLSVDIYGDQPMKITFDIGLMEILSQETITLNVVDISDESAYEVEMED